MSGHELLRRLRQQASHYGVDMVHGTAHSLTVLQSGFELEVDHRPIRAATILLASGVRDRKPAIAEIPDIREATLAGAVRWCPICDGYEVQDQHVGLISPPVEGYRHVLFLRTYTRQLSWFVQGDAGEIGEARRAVLAELDIELIRSPISQVHALPGPRVILVTEDGKSYHLDTLYPMTGCEPRVEILEGLEARQDEFHQLWVDEHQQTSIGGIYAAGDVVQALNQMSVGAAHAATAATAIHNALPRNYR
ncbi:MAG: NAD(P)/FAD-dependent oxidoreductase [Pseudomonadota bacterium]|nr:NAD(P)/FAD-dependent oxidoreductase [Pseudomonadota bacterium]